MTRDQRFAVALAAWLFMGLAMYWWLVGGGCAATVTILVLFAIGFWNYMAGESDEGWSA